MYDYNNECDCDFCTVPFWTDNDTPAFYRQIIQQEEVISGNYGKAPEYDLTGRFAIKMKSIYSEAMLRVSYWSAEYDKLRDLRDYYADRMLAHNINA